MILHVLSVEESFSASFRAIVNSPATNKHFHLTRVIIFIFCICILVQGVWQINHLLDATFPRTESRKFNLQTAEFRSQAQSLTTGLLDLADEVLFFDE